jgi:hypothetical protein
MATAMIRPALAFLLLGLAPASAQDFAFRQDCTLTLFACDLVRDGDPDACPAGMEVKAKFFAEGESFNLSADGLADDPADGEARLFPLGQGYISDSLRVYFFQDNKDIDGLFWIGADGRSGAHLYRNGIEDYLEGTCTPLPE